MSERRPFVHRVIALGGALGATARYAMSLWIEPSPGGFPWATFAVNLVGCALIGVLMAALEGNPRAHPLLRPFLGPGVLGGFTTFSTYAVDLRALADAGEGALAVGYAVGTLAGALAATWLAAALTRNLRRTSAAPGASEQGRSRP